MDDFQIVVYIILVVIYIISRVLKAKKKAAGTSQPLPHNTREIRPQVPYEQPKPISEPRQMTFEDLLKEFTGYEQPQPEVITDRPVATQPVKTSEQDQTFRGETQSNENIPPYKSASPYDNTPAYVPEPAYEKPDTLNRSKAYKPLKPYKDPLSTSHKVTSEDTRPSDINKLRFSKYATLKGQDVHTASRFRKLLTNSITIKDAVVLKEILDTKFF